MQQVLSDLDRRTIANLSIPRNVADLTHTLRIDPFTKTRTDVEVAGHLSELEDFGLVVNVGSGDDGAGQLVAAAQKNPDALDIPDAKAQVFEKRRDDLRRTWQIEGDTYMLTRKGLEWVQAPPPDAPGPMEPSRLRDVINAEYARIAYSDTHRFEGSIYDQAADVAAPHLAGGILLDENGKPYEGDAGPTLGDRLLPEEFNAWLGSVLTEYDRLYSNGATFRKQLRIPIAGGAGWSDAYEVIILDAENQKSTITAAAPWFMALSILAFTDSDTGTIADNGTHVPTYTGWGRKSVAASDMNSASAGSATNANAIQFAACTGGTSTILGFGNCDAATVGVLRKYGTCSSTVISTTQTPAQFAVAAYTTSAD